VARSHALTGLVGRRRGAHGVESTTDGK
jgi:hypothetical protein